jgi:uroporphyrinogen decarboxylase
MYYNAKDRLSDKEWIYNTLSHIKKEKIPYHFDFTPPARKKLIDYFGSEYIEDILELPIRWCGPNTIKPHYPDPDIYGDTIKDEFGVTWSVSKNDRGAPLIPILPEPYLTNYVFPNPSEDYRFKDLGKWCSINEDHFRVIWIGDLWERANFMRGMENLLMDLVLNKSFVSELLERLADYILETMKIIINRFECEALSLSDDYGSQKSLLMSPEDWRRFLKPNLKKITGMAKKHDKVIMLHSCGNVYEIIPDLIDLGLDILHPIQPEVMDIYQLKREFGNDISFQGGLRTQDLLPLGNPDDVKKEVRKLKRKMGKGGGYILEPGITIQGDVPIENLLAMFEEASK